MSNLYLDLHSGASGDMLVACLLGFDDDIDYLNKRLESIGVKNYRIKYYKEERHGIIGNRFEVITEEEPHHRTYRDIISLIENSSLSNEEKELSKNIFRIIGEAEAKIHGVELDEVHFHEIGLIDSIIDIIGFSILINKFRFKRVYCSPVPLGSGTGNSLHGRIPLPSPATVEILKGVPVYGMNIRNELTTPTGAGIIKAIVDDFGPLPPSVIHRISCSFGKRQTPEPNLLRGYIIEEYSSISIQPEETVAQIECTIDDSTPEEMGYLQKKLFDEGALDVYFVPVLMKKNRPGWNIAVISNPESCEKIADLLLSESTSFGIRFSILPRKTIPRKTIKVNTELGEINVKIGFVPNKTVKISPEYEDCKRIAGKTGLPLREVMFVARKAAEEKLNIKNQYRH